MSQSNYPPTQNYSEAAFQDESSISLNHIFHIFWLRKTLFIAVFVFVFIAGTVIVFQLTPKFTTETKILVGIDKAKVVDVEAVLSGNLGTDSAVKSETEVLTSKGLAKKIITKLGLLNMEEFNPNLKEKSFFAEISPSNWFSDEFKASIGLLNKKEPLTEEEAQERLMATATNIYLSKLKAAPVRGSQVISVTFESPDPKLAAHVTNTHAESYIIGQLEAKFEATQKASSWLNEQLSGLRSKVESSERAVEIYRKDHGLSKGTNESGLVGEQLSEINSQLIIAKAERAEKSARLTQVTQLLRNGTDIETASEVLSSALIQNLRQEEAELQRKVSEMSVELGAKHPKLIRINAEILDLRGKIKSEITKIASGLKNELNIASTREASLQNSLQAQENKSGSHREEEVQLRALEREANANKVLFETFLNRFKETSSTQGMEEADARVISAAEVPVSPSFPKKDMMMALIAVLATFSGTAVIFVLEMLHPGLRTPEEIERFLGIPAIALLPQIDRKIDPFNYVLDKPHSSLSEALSSLRVSLMLSDPDKNVQSVMVTSSLPAEGKSTTALCLARSAAFSGQKVIVIDADFRRPTIEKKLNIATNTKGLTDYILAHDGKYTDFIVQDDRTNMYIMSKGKADYVNPVDILSSHKMEALLLELKQNFDLIIIDTPPVMAVTDARVLASMVDKTLFVVYWDKTPRQVVKTGLEELLKANPSIAGIVLQQVNFKEYSSYSYGESGYYYNYSKYGQYYTN
ncbi:MAG: polysaccharide biosynthesis tyrosine autokinase [Methylovulum sp.]|nr:polysaccharide biosynthesis tyrosine autokinase [Methylovulum sp.]